MRLYDKVRLTHDLPAEWVRGDLVGTIVEIFHDPSEMYEVSFTNEDGTPYAEIAVTPDQVELLQPPPGQGGQIQAA